MGKKKVFRKYRVGGARLFVYCVMVSAGLAYGGAGYGNGVSYGSGTYNGATNSSYRSNGGTRTTPNTGYLNGAGTMTGTGDLSSTDMGTNGGTSNVSADM